MPVLALLRWRRPGGRRHSLWLPLFLLWLVLLPLILILLPILILALAVAGARPFATLTGLWNVFAAVRGTRVEFRSGGGLLIIHVF